MPRVLLFDIDNTLLWSGGAGGQAMTAVFHDLFGIADGFERVEFAGRTDRYIFAEALRQHRIAGDHDAHLKEMTARYFGLLPDALKEKKGHLMPGFPQLLERLGERPELRLGLATGNFSQSAHLKLAHFGIDRFFAGGGFGEESEDRADVVRLAMRRLADGASPRDVLIIGDTPHDISSALANGATAVGVATGSYSADQLRDCGAHLVFQDLGQWQEVATLLAGS